MDALCSERLIEVFKICPELWGFLLLSLGHWYEPMKLNAITYNSLGWLLACIPLYYLYVCSYQLAFTAFLAPTYNYGVVFCAVCAFLCVLLATS